VTAKKRRSLAGQAIRLATGLPHPVAMGLGKVLYRGDLDAARQWAVSRGVVVVSYTEERLCGHTHTTYRFVGPRGAFEATD